VVIVPPNLGADEERSLRVLKFVVCVAHGPVRVFAVVRQVHPPIRLGDKNACAIRSMRKDRITSAVRDTPSHHRRLSDMHFARATVLVRRGQDIYECPTSGGHDWHGQRRKNVNITRRTDFAKLAAF
jgi:hypothetical protein